MSDWSILVSSWSAHFPTGPAPKFLVRTPGRVNLIGEHVDHQSYPVCPCALGQSIGAVVSIETKTAANNLLELCHVQSGKYSAKVYKNAAELKVEDAKVWSNYVCAAFFGVVEYYLVNENAVSVGKLITPKSGLTPAQIENSLKIAKSPLNYSIRILFDGNVPVAAGLSSSAALVVTTALAALNVSGSPPSNRAVADLCARAERYTGVASGGMDQAAVLLSQEGSATLIHFNPLTTATVGLPSGGALIIANTCRESPKALMAAKMYNKRVFELKVGCLALLPKSEADAITADELLDLQLRDVVRVRLQTTEKALLEALPTKLENKVWTKDDALKVLGPERKKMLLQKRCGEDVWTANDDFHVYNRIRHVLSEALRVEDFAKTARDTTLSDSEKLERLGELMNGSGQSLNTDFDCSCPEIEEIVRICLAHGAYGCRLTGAGWGGCTVALVPVEKQTVIIAAIKKEYFDPIYAGSKTMVPALECLPPKELLDSCVFATSPSQGAYLLKL